MIAIGIDVGTSGLDALAIDTDSGRVVAHASHAYPLDTPHPGWAEQDPRDYLTAADGALSLLVRKLDRDVSRVRSIGLTGQMHTAVLLDGDHNALRPAMLWCDSRAGLERAVLDRIIADTGVRERIGNRALPGFTLPKLAWLKQHEPEVLASLKHVLMPKDYVGLHLTGELGGDWSDASGTLCFDQLERRWCQPLLDELHFDGDWFPRVDASTSALGTLRGELCEQLGLPATTRVYRGAADNAAAAVAMGVVTAGSAMVSLGTSGTVVAATSELVIEPEMRLHSFCHANPGSHYLMGVMLAAGGALRWYRDTLCDGEGLAAEMRGVDAYDIICDAASTAREGCGGVVFLPYLMGERTPHHDDRARACLVGMTARTTKADISRAVLEGISFGLSDSFDLVTESAGAVDEVRITGGGARSPFWRQLIANVLGCEVVTTTSSDGACFGAAMLAAVGAGAFDDVPTACDALVHNTARVRPDAVTHQRYQDIRGAYRGLYGDLKRRFRGLATIEGS